MGDKGSEKERDRKRGSEGEIGRKRDGERGGERGRRNEMIFKQDKIEATQEDRTLNWRHNIQHNDTQHNRTQHNGLQYNGTEYFC